MGFTLGIHPTLNDLNAIEAATQRVHAGLDHKVGGFGAGLFQVATHGYTLGVTDSHRVTGMDIFLDEVPTAEEANCHARTGGGVSFLALHSVKQGSTGVFMGPDTRVARSDQHIAGNLTKIRLYEGMAYSVSTGLDTGRFTKEVILISSGQCGMAVCCATNTKLVGVNAELFLQLQT